MSDLREKLAANTSLSSDLKKRGEVRSDWTVREEGTSKLSGLHAEVSSDGIGADPTGSPPTSLSLNTHQKQVKVSISLDAAGSGLETPNDPVFTDVPEILEGGLTKHFLHFTLSIASSYDEDGDDECFDWRSISSEPNLIVNTFAELFLDEGECVPSSYYAAKKLTHYTSREPSSSDLATAKDADAEQVKHPMGVEFSLANVVASSELNDLAGGKANASTGAAGLRKVCCSYLELEKVREKYATADATTDMMGVKPAAADVKVLPEFTSVSRTAEPLNETLPASGLLGDTKEHSKSTALTKNGAITSVFAAECLTNAAIHEPSAFATDAMPASAEGRVLSSAASLYGPGMYKSVSPEQEKLSEGAAQVGGEWARNKEAAFARNRLITREVRLNVLQNVPKDLYKFSKEEVAEAESEWNATLIGVLLGSLVSPDVMTEFIKNNWEVEMPKIYIKENRVMIFKFKKIEECNWVLRNGPWMLGGNKPLILKQCRTGISIDWTSFESVPVWVKIIDIDPIFISSKQMINIIGNM